MTPPVDLTAFLAELLLLGEEIPDWLTEMEPGADDEPGADSEDDDGRHA